ncbi:MAG: 2-hydroxyacid dehydrogenase [Sporomusaceae bacterium]|nr:2-hydroxyacid dehydrogenase [Sporomusaceae bacterium]
MKKVLFINGNDKRIAELFQQIAPPDFSVVCISNKDNEEQQALLLAEADYLVLHPAVLSEKLLKAGVNLKLVQALSAGYDQIDITAAQKRQIPVATNGGANSWAVAEHAITLLLALYKKLSLSEESVRAGKWRQATDSFNIFEVAGKTVGIIGAGNIGSKVARRLKAFETEILYTNLGKVPDLEKNTGAIRVPLEELLAKSDILSLHAPLLPSTRGMIGERELSLMKATSVIINTSRAELIDQAALVNALQSNKIAGAGIDVFTTEPVSLDDPLLTLANVLVSPHIAGHSCEGWSRRIRFAWENIRRIEQGEVPLSVVRAE